TVEIVDLFKVEDGQIRRLEAVSAALPYLQPDSWSAATASHVDSSGGAVAALTDRIAVEDMLANYYALFSARTHSDFGAYYTEDGVLDANGMVARGRDPINALYKGIGETGNIQILISNPRIVLNGDTATVDLVWTECNSETHSAVPRIVEQGHE